MRFLRCKSLSELDRASEEEGSALKNDDNNIKGDGSLGTLATQPSSSPSTPFQCKPDISCWNFLPKSLTEKWTKLKR